VQPGQLLTYTLVVTNAGQSTAQNVVLSASVPANTAITGTIDGGQYVPGLLAGPFASPQAPAAGNDYVTWSDNLMPGESHKIRFSVVVNTSITAPELLTSVARGYAESELNFEIPLTVTVNPQIRVFLPIARKGD
jgi:uncharacterized repeat protein (TIGR01451 family)